MKTSNLDLKTLKNMGLNDSVNVTKGSLTAATELIVKLTEKNAAYEFSTTQVSPRIYTITRVLPAKYLDRAVYFDTVTKRQVQQAMKANDNVKIKAAAQLGMSPRTFRRKIAEFALNF